MLLVDAKRVLSISALPRLPALHGPGPLLRPTVAASAPDRPITPLYLPRRHCPFCRHARALMGTIGWCVYHDPEKTEGAGSRHRWTPSSWSHFLPLGILGAFFFWGVLVRARRGTGKIPRYFLQDLEAWGIADFDRGPGRGRRLIHLIIGLSLENSLSPADLGKAGCWRR